MMEKLNFKRDKIVDIQKALQTADINNDKQLDFDEWRKDLKRCDFVFEKIVFIVNIYNGSSNNSSLRTSQ